jgi:hypothetical protein
MPAATLHVWQDSPNPASPFSDWASAVHTIQEAVDAASAGDLVLVTNGVYAGGLAVTNPLTLLSVNGPQFTIINGGGTNQCISLTGGASVSGFSLTNGFGGFGGGVWCAATNCSLTNCTLSGNRAYSGGGACGGALYNCTLSVNSAEYGGGGASESTLYNCAVSGNLSVFGGGTYFSSLYNCTLNGNSVQGQWMNGVGQPEYRAGRGGGADSCTLYNCTLSGNSALLGSDPQRGNAGGGASYSTLYECTLSGNLSWGSGGGTYSSALYTCTVIGNTAYNPPQAYGWGNGGGAWGGTVSNCTLTDNSAVNGGGASYATLHGCTLLDNLAYDSGGGVESSTLANCIVAYNASWNDPNYTGSTLDYCCTSPLPTNGFANISVPPLFVDYANGNLRLQSNSPCINAGNNAYVTTTTNRDGNPRIVSGTVDIGAYEYQGTGSRISYAWLQQYGLPTDGSADFIDSDHDSLNNWQEWICGTDPTNPQSVLNLLSATPTSTNATVTWQSVAGVNYFLECSANLGSPFTLLATNIIGQTDTTSYADTNAAGGGPLFYRVGVKSP